MLWVVKRTVSLIRYVEYPQCILFAETYENQYFIWRSENIRCDMGGSRGCTWSLDPPPLKNHKHIWFLGAPGPDPPKIYKATKPAFNVGPSSARQRGLMMTRFKSYLDPPSSHQLTKKRCQICRVGQNLLDPRLDDMIPYLSAITKPSSTIKGTLLKGYFFTKSGLCWSSEDKNNLISK